MPPYLSAAAHTCSCCMIPCMAAYMPVLDARRAVACMHACSQRKRAWFCYDCRVALTEAPKLELPFKVRPPLPCHTLGILVQSLASACAPKTHAWPRRPQLYVCAQYKQAACPPEVPRTRLRLHMRACLVTGAHHHAPRRATQQEHGRAGGGAGAAARRAARVSAEQRRLAWQGLHARACTQAAWALAGSVTDWCDRCWDCRGRTASTAATTLELLALPRPRH